MCCNNYRFGSDRMNGAGRKFMEMTQYRNMQDSPQRAGDGTDRFAVYAAAVGKKP